MIEEYHSMATTARKTVIGYAARDTSGHLSPFEFTRRATGDYDVAFKVFYCGICHTDLHLIRNEWNMSIYPMVPGHEVVGVVTEVGKNVHNIQIGDHVGVGYVVDSCDNCDACEKYQEQYCDKAIYVFNSVDKDGSTTQGGYSTLMVANQKFVARVPKHLPLDAAAPLLCAGITVYSPMKYFNLCEPGKHLGVVGLGGLGHIAVKFGKAFGLHVTVISTSIHKKHEAIHLLGADKFLLSSDLEQMKDSTKSLDYIINTVSSVHPLEPLLNLLKINGKMILVGIPEIPLQISASSIVFERRFISGSFVGGTKEMQEMLDFCGEHNITCVIETIPIGKVNDAMKRLEKGDVKYRFVIDITNTMTNI